MIKTENAVNGEPNFSFNSWGDFLVGNVSTFSQTLPDIIPDLHFVNSEAYVQDDWKVSPRLTLNLGVRWSRLPSVTDVRNTLSNFDPAFYSPQLAPEDRSHNRQLPSRPGYQRLHAACRPRTPTASSSPRARHARKAAAISPLVTCSPFGAYMNPNYNANFGPRLGFAYDPTGKGKDGRSRRLRHLL